MKINNNSTIGIVGLGLMGTSIAGSKWPKSNCLGTYNFGFGQVSTQSCPEFLR